jgi:hypothetical protein
MGACNFIVFGRGATAREAFDELVIDAEFQYGHDPYNGTISTTSLSRRPAKVIRKQYAEKAREEAKKFAERDGWGEKWESRVLDLGIVGWEVSTYEKTPRTSQIAAKVSYQTFYVGYADDREICCEKTAAAAKQRVIDHMERNGRGVVERYQVRKESRCIKDGKVVDQNRVDTRSFEMVRKTRVTKSKPKNRNARAIHMWAFYGWASC